MAGWQVVQHPLFPKTPASCIFLPLPYWFAEFPFDPLCFPGLLIPKYYPNKTCIRNYREMRYPHAFLHLAQNFDLMLTGRSQCRKQHTGTAVGDVCTPKSFNLRRKHCLMASVRGVATEWGVCSWAQVPRPWRSQLTCSAVFLPHLLLWGPILLPLLITTCDSLVQSIYSLQALVFSTVKWEWWECHLSHAVQKVK